MPAFAKQAPAPKAHATTLKRLPPKEISTLNFGGAGAKKTLWSYLLSDGCLFCKHLYYARAWWCHLKLDTLQIHTHVWYSYGSDAGNVDANGDFHGHGGAGNGKCRIIATLYKGAARKSLREGSRSCGFSAQEVAEFQRELRGSQGMGVVSDNWFDCVLLSILYMFKPSCWPTFKPPSLGPPQFPLQ